MKELLTPEQILDIRFQEIQDKVNAIIAQEVEVGQAKIRFMYRHSVNYLEKRELQMQQSRIFYKNRIESLYLKKFRELLDYFIKPDNQK